MINMPIQPRYEPEPDEMDELDHGDDIHVERGAPRSGGVHVVIGTSHPGAMSWSAEQARAAGYGAHVGAIPPVAHVDHDPFETERMHDPARHYERQSDIYGRTDDAVTIQKLRDRVFELERANDGIEDAQRIMREEIDFLRRLARRSINEAAAANENLTATQARCTELRNALVDSKVIDRLTGQGFDDPLVWQLVGLGAEKIRSTVVVPTRDGAVAAMGAALMATGESSARAAWLWLAAVALGLSAGERAGEGR